MKAKLADIFDRTPFVESYENNLLFGHVRPEERHMLVSATNIIPCLVAEDGFRGWRTQRGFHRTGVVDAGNDFGDKVIVGKPTPVVNILGAAAHASRRYRDSHQQGAGFCKQRLFLFDTTRLDRALATPYWRIRKMAFAHLRVNATGYQHIGRANASAKAERKIAGMASMESLGSAVGGLWGWLRRALGLNPERAQAHHVYAAIVRQARNPGFYSGLGVADTLDGRFDMLCVHVFLVLRRLKENQALTEAFAQTLFDVFFTDMDRSLREMGVGDLSVGKRVRAMSKAFMGRIDAYDRALDDGEGLADALVRNLYRGQAPQPEQLSAIVEYVSAEAGSLAAQPLELILAGHTEFGPLPA